jgi:hypothetical protein
MELKPYSLDNPPLTSVVRDYMKTQTSEHKIAVYGALEQIRRKSTESFVENANTVVGAGMIVARTEIDYVGNALWQYAEQDGLEQSRILANLNYPAGTEPGVARGIRGMFDDFINEHPEVPFAYFEGPAKRPVRVGGLRKLVSEVLLNYAAQDTPGDMLIVGHDADIEKLSANHFIELAKSFKEHPYAAGHVPHSHYKRYLNLPNMDKVITLMDDWDMQQATYVFFEPGPGISARAMMEVGGYDPQLGLAETFTLLNAIALKHGGAIALVPEAKIAMSPRRLYSIMRDSPQDMEFWPDHDSVGADNEYREIERSNFAEWTDISIAERDIRLSYIMQRRLEVLYNVYTAYNFDPPIALMCAFVTLEKIQKKLNCPEDLALKAAKQLAEREGVTFSPSIARRRL